MNKNTTSNQEDYLEAIHKILQDRPVVRVKEIAAELEVSKPSVTSALQTLSRDGLVNYEPYGLITLTTAGEKKAGMIFQKHKIIEEFFETILGIEEQAAAEQACVMEHGLDNPTFKRLIMFMRYHYEHEGDKDLWLKKFSDFCDKNPIDGLKAEEVQEFLHKE